MQKRLGLDLEIPDEFGYWLAGFTDGEGHFSACITINQLGHRQLDVAFIIELRKDDKSILEEIQNILGIGVILVRKPTGDKRSKPTARYTIGRLSDLYHIVVPLFDKYPLRTKKTKDFKIWKRIIGIKYHEGARRPLGLAPGGLSLGTMPPPESYWGKIEPLIERLQEQRKFR